MRTYQHRFWKLAVLAAWLAAAPGLTGVVRAQAPEGPDTTSATTEDSTGEVTAITPNQTITVNSRRGPFTYRLGRDLHVIGLDGKPAKVSQVHAGEKVTVYYYMRDGQETVARIAVLAAAAKKDK